MAEVFNSKTVSPPWRLTGRRLTVAIIVLALLVGTVFGYLLANQRDNKKIQDLDTRVGLAERNVVFVHDRFYYNDEHNFALIVPENWVKNYLAINDSNSAKFSFRSADSSAGTKSAPVGTKYQPVFTIYKCSIAVYKQSKGQTDDPAKCPGEFIRQDPISTYTWKANGTKYTFTDKIGSSDRVIDDWKQKVLQTFQIVR